MLSAWMWKAKSFSISLIFLLKYANSSTCLHFYYTVKVNCMMGQQAIDLMALIAIDFKLETILSNFWEMCNEWVNEIKLHH